MPSSAIRHLFYRPETHELSIWFNPDGRRYKYYDVPEELAEELKNAPSRGSFFNSRIKGRFESRKIEAEKPSHRSRFPISRSH